MKGWGDGALSAGSVEGTGQGEKGAVCLPMSWFVKLQEFEFFLKKNKIFSPHHCCDCGLSVNKLYEFTQELYGGHTAIVCCGTISGLFILKGN